MGCPWKLSGSCSCCKMQQHGQLPAPGTVLVSSVFHGLHWLSVRFQVQFKALFCLLKHLMAWGWVIWGATSPWLYLLISVDIDILWIEHSGTYFTLEPVWPFWSWSQFICPKMHHYCYPNKICWLLIFRGPSASRQDFFKGVYLIFDFFKGVYLIMSVIDREKQEFFLEVCWLKVVGSASFFTRTTLFTN